MSGFNTIINGYYKPGQDPTFYTPPDEKSTGPLADLVNIIENMNLPQIAVSEQVIEPSAQELDVEELKCEKAIDKYLKRSLKPREYKSWRKGNEKSLLTNRPLSGFEFLLRTNQRNYPTTYRKQEIFHSIRENQLTLVSGRVGDGRSTCIPQLCLQYLKATKDCSSILMVSTNKASANWIAGRLCKELGVDEDSLEREGRLELSTDVDEIINLDHNTPRICILGSNDALRLMATRPLLDNFAIVIMDDVDTRRVAQDFIFSIIKTYCQKNSHLKFIFTSSFGKLEYAEVDPMQKDLSMFLSPFKLNHIIIPKINPVSFNLCQIKFGHLPTREERFRNVKDILQNVDRDDTDILLVCDDHYETEYIAEKLEQHINKQISLKLIPNCKIIKLHSQIPANTLRRASQRMTIRSALELLPSEFTVSNGRRARMIIVADSSLAENNSISSKIGVVIDLGGYSQKRWDEKLQKWTSETVGINLKQAEARMRRAISAPNVVYRLRDPVRVVNEGEKESNEAENSTSRSSSRRNSRAPSRIGMESRAEFRAIPDSEYGSSSNSSSDGEDDDDDGQLPELCWSRLSQQLLLMLKAIRGLTSMQEDYNLDHSLLREPYDIPKFQNGIIELVALELITANLDTFTENLTITDKGLWISEMPLAPEYGTMLLESWHKKCSHEILTIVSMLIAVSRGSIEHWLSKNDPKIVKSVIDEFRCFKGDHFTLINIFDAFTENDRMITWCKSVKLPYRMLSIADRARKVLSKVCQNIGIQISEPKEQIDEETYQNILDCIFKGYQSQAKIAVLQYLAPIPEITKFGQYQLPDSDERVQRELLKINNQVIGVYKILRYNYPANCSQEALSHGGDVCSDDPENRTFAIIDLDSSCHKLGYLPKAVIFTCLQESEEKSNEKFPNMKILQQAHAHHMLMRFGVKPKKSKIKLPDNVMKLCSEIDINFLLENIRFDECSDYNLIRRIAAIDKEDLVKSLNFWMIGAEKPKQSQQQNQQQNNKRYRYDSENDFNQSTSNSETESSSEYETDSEATSSDDESGGETTTSSSGSSSSSSSGSDSETDTDSSGKYIKKYGSGEDSSSSYDSSSSEIDSSSECMKNTSSEAVR